MKYTIIAVTIYRRAGEWCYTASTPEGVDHTGIVGSSHDASEEKVRAEIAEMFPNAAIVWEESDAP